MSQKRSTHSVLQESVKITNKESNKEVIQVPLQFSVDHSIRGTAKCKHCKKKIEKNILRIGKLEQFKKKEIVRYAHVDCSLKSLRKAAQQDPILDVSLLKGFDDLNDKDRDLIKN